MEIELNVSASPRRIAGVSPSEQKEGEEKQQKILRKSYSERMAVKPEPAALPQEMDLLASDASQYFVPNRIGGLVPQVPVSPLPFLSDGSL